MNIACLGWGSLIWKPGDLEIQRRWFEDGPFLPIEFARQSKDGRLTLVIEPSSRQVRSLWTLMTSPTIEAAKESLRKREDIPEAQVDTEIGVLRKNDLTQEPIKAVVLEWLMKTRLDAVIWTNLGPKFADIHRPPTNEEAIQYIRGLDLDTRRLAEEYVKKAPPQIDTMFRRSFAEKFGW